MIALADALKAQVVKRDLTEDEKWAVADILDAAAEWAAGALPLQTFARIGALPSYDARGKRVDSCGYGRALALMATPQDDPRWSALNAAIRELVRRQDVVVTRQGIFGRDELAEAGAVVR